MRITELTTLRREEIISGKDIFVEPVTEVESLKKKQSTETF